MRSLSRLSIASPVALPIALAAFAPSAAGQWSTDPTANLAVADGANEQVQPKILRAPDGGFYISWFDNDPGGSPAFGYDVRLQRLDSGGNELWAHGGILVADRGFSSTQDYGLDVDLAGNAYLTFRDDRPGGIQITAAKIDPSGALVWGSAGVQLTSTTDFVAAPKIACTSDGSTVVAWTQLSSVRLQKLDASGVAQWSPDVVYTPAMGSYSASDLHGSDAGSVILAIVHQTGAFGSPRHLLAQKLDPAGASLWAAGHVAVFDGGSLQNGNFPIFVTDGAGGAVFGWYGVAPLQCRAQHVLASGAEAFVHDGALASTNATRVRVSPWAAYDAGSGRTLLFWTEQNSLQSMSGVYGQAFDASGARQWTDDGRVLVALGSSEITQVRTTPVASGGAMVFWVETLSVGNQRLQASRVDAAGAFLVSPFSASSAASAKSRLALAWSPAGFTALAWSDARSDPNDVYAQDVNLDGSLGSLSARTCVGTSANCPCGNGGAPDAGCENAQGSGGVVLGLGTFLPDGVGGGTATLSGTGFPPASSPTAIVIRSPGELDPPVVFGDGLRCVSSAGLVRFGATQASGGASSHAANHGAGAGTFHYQIWYRSSPASYCDTAAAFNVSSGLSLTWP